MPRGIKVDIEQYLTNIKPYLEVGCTVHEACLHGMVPYTTIVDYMNNDEEVRRKIERMGNVPILIARQSVVGSMRENAELALKYLERKKKDEFSLKTESEQKVDGTIQFTWENNVDHNTIQTEEASNSGS